MSEYRVVPVTRYLVTDENNVQVPFTLSYHNITQAAEAAEALRRRDARLAEQKERDRLARSQPGKWTPASLRAHLATDPHWEMDDYTGDPNFRGIHKCVWRTLDPEQPFITRRMNDGSTFEEPQYSIYGGDCYIVYINDDDNNSKAEQFTIRDTAIESGRYITFATVDRLAAALIRRGLMQPKAKEAVHAGHT